MKDFFGIIGGLGPKATANFINNIIDRTAAEEDQEHLNFMLFNHSTIPDRTAYILDHSNPNPLPYLLADVEKMSDNNVSFIVIPCNTAHYFYEELQRNSSVQIVNMIRETVSYTTECFANEKRIGILGTQGTLHANLYQQELLNAELTPIVPTKRIQQKLNRLIYNQVKRGGDIDHHTYFDILKSMVELGCDRIILGCTELSLIENVAPKHHFPIVDAQAVLAEKTILLAGKQIKRPDKQSNIAQFS